MRLRFLDRTDERKRLEQALDHREGSFVCLFGRRRCGKSRLLQEVLGDRDAVYLVADDRHGSLQRRSLARALAEQVPGIERVEYPDWDTLLDRWWREAPAGCTLAIDEFPAMVSAAPELPSLLQKHLDGATGRGLSLVLCGSSQRMMQGLVLDGNAPLYGRAREILEIHPLGAAWLEQAFGTRSVPRLLDLNATWGGVPRYWELARDHSSHWPAVRSLVLDPLGVLNDEPRRLLLDDMREITQAASVLALVGQGCHRISEIAGRLGQPVTSLSRPLQRLIELGLVRRETPFGAAPRRSKQSFYVIDDPFLAFWFRFVEPNRSRLQAGAMRSVEQEIRRSWDVYLGTAWERLARDAVPRLAIGGRRWKPAARWWGAGDDRRPMEIDIVAESEDGEALLVGEAKLALDAAGRRRAEAKLTEKIARFPLARDREVVPALFVASGRKASATSNYLTGRAVIEALV